MFGPPDDSSREDDFGLPPPRRVRNIQHTRNLLQQRKNRLVSGAVSISHHFCERDRARQIPRLFRKRQVPNARRIHPRALPSQLRLSRPSERSQSTIRLPNSRLATVSVPQFCTIAHFRLLEEDFLLPMSTDSTISWSKVRLFVLLPAQKCPIKSNPARLQIVLL